MLDPTTAQTPGHPYMVFPPPPLLGVASRNTNGHFVDYVNSLSVTYILEGDRTESEDYLLAAFI